MLGELEDFAAVGALALEHGAAVVQGVGQDVDVGLAPRTKLAVHPDEAVAVVIGNELGHDAVLVGAFEECSLLPPDPSAGGQRSLRCKPEHRARLPCENDLPGVSIGLKYVNMTDITRDTGARSAPDSPESDGRGAGRRRRQNRGSHHPRRAASSSPIAISRAIRMPFSREYGFGRAHHRVLHFVQQEPGPQGCQPSRNSQDHQAELGTRPEAAHRRGLHHAAGRRRGPPRAPSLRHGQRGTSRRQSLRHLQVQSGRDGPAEGRRRGGMRPRAASCSK